jgi:dTDP-4-dehydrorhamnose 3,5-epimerase
VPEQTAVPSTVATPIEGVELLRLTTHADDRGSFTELFRRTWVDVDFRQWNVVRSSADVLRGVHLHKVHYDYLTVLEGAAHFGMRDLRRGSPTEGKTYSVTLSGDSIGVLRVPPGVAHGFCFLQPSLHLYAVSHYWDIKDELGCRYDDPALELQWPVARPHVSKRDADLPALAQLLLDAPTWTPTPASIVLSPSA